MHTGATLPPAQHSSSEEDERQQATGIADGDSDHLSAAAAAAAAAAASSSNGEPTTAGRRTAAAEQQQLWPPDGPLPSGKPVAPAAVAQPTCTAAAVRPPSPTLAAAFTAAADTHLNLHAAAEIAVVANKQRRHVTPRHPRASSLYCAHVCGPSGGNSEVPCPQYHLVALAARIVAPRSARAALAMLVLASSATQIVLFGVELAATDLERVGAGCLGIGLLPLTGILQTLRHATKPDGGLERLGASHVKISLAAKKYLNRAGFVLSALAVCGFTGGVFVILQPLLFDTSWKALFPELERNALSVINFQLAGILWLSLWPLGLACALCLIIGATLAQDAIVDVVQPIRVLSPIADADEWDAQVVLPTNALAHTTMPTLSECFGPGIAAVTVACCIISFGTFALFLANDSLGMAALTALFLLLPLLPLWPLATCSTACSNILVTLNDCRLAHLTVDETGAHTRIRAIELALRQLNHDAGMGFVIFNQVGAARCAQRHRSVAEANHGAY
eukprot:COSAG05_NODE_789_length_7324_cov_4.272664_3_plen_506_part_00